MSDWYADWQNGKHAREFDARARLSRRELIRRFEAFNDVRLLMHRADAQRAQRLVEVGCATGEFYRYVASELPKVEYHGLDISEPALARASRKYPEASWHLVRPGVPLANSLLGCGIDTKPEIVYAKDVVHHQVRPFEFLDELCAVAGEMLILRLRTRDTGPTELDPEKSCQHHYGGWMPYIVLNLTDAIDRLRAALPQAEIVAVRHHMVLGGEQQRFLPKDCYLEETGTAETAVGVFLQTHEPGAVRVMDRTDEEPAPSLKSRVRHVLGGR
jgi:hypothetical protein